MGYIISIIIGFGVGIVTGLYLRSSNEYAARSLQNQLQISKGQNPVTENSTAYYTVRITIGKGNWYCRLLRLLHIHVSLVVSGSIRWIPADDPNSIGFHAHVYPLGTGRRILKDAPNFLIIPNTEIELAVLKSEQGDRYALGGFMPDIPLREDYNMQLELRNQDTQLLPGLHLATYLSKVGLISKNS